MTTPPDDTSNPPSSRPDRQRRKYHHYRPVLHLRHFADARERVWIYDKRGQFVPVQQRIQELGGESFLYSPEIGPDPRSDAVEVWLEQVIDTPAAEPLRKALQNLALSPSERSRLAAFIGAQDMRTPKAWATIMPLFQNGMNHVRLAWMDDIPALRQAILADSGDQSEEEDLRQYLEEHEMQVEKPVWLQFMMDNINRAGERIYNMEWHLIDAPTGHEFLTNDIGLIKFTDGFKVPSSYVVGFAGGRERWLVPLSHQRALALAPTERAAPVDVTPDWLQTVNRRVVADALRFVYSASFHGSVLDQIKDSPTAA